MGWFLNGTTGISLYVNFRPRLGLGWFRVPSLQSKRVLKFSSPLGDGLVRDCVTHQSVHDAWVFVPEWGWVGSVLTMKNIITAGIFVPEWGWVGSLITAYRTTVIIFSSPLGVGLVLSLIPSDCDRYIIFVPAWGWVGSYQ